MSGKYAATVGQLTEHDAVLTAPGSSDVLINSRGAWRAEIDVHSCAKHGPETVTAGSETVLVNGHRATRLGDFLLGGGVFNRIMQGSTNVLIGTPAVGCAAPDNAKKFCAGYCALKHDWPNLTSGERKARMEGLIADQFKSFGAPAPQVTDSIKAESGDAGSWSCNQWALNFPEGTFDKTAPPDSGDVFHEVRHGEQDFMAMRERAGRTANSDGPDADPARGSGAVSPSALSDMAGVPLEAARAAARQPLDPDTPEARWAHVAAAEDLNQDGKTRSNKVIENYDKAQAADAANEKHSVPGYQKRAKDAYQYYRELPNGQDAHDMEGLIGDCGC